jgi:hypothetical protein
MVPVLAVGLPLRAVGVLLRCRHDSGCVSHDGNVTGRAAAVIAERPN